MHPLLKKILDPPLLSFLILTNVPLVSSNQHWLLDALTASYGMVDSLSFMEVKMTTNQSLRTLYWGLLICAIQGCAQTGTDPSQFFKRKVGKTNGPRNKRFSLLCPMAFLKRCN